MSTTIQRHAVGVTWHESAGMARAAHAVADGDRVWLIDPFEDAAALQAAADLGTPVGVLQLLDRHQRDGEAIAERLGVPLTRIPSSLPGTPFEVRSVIDRRWWKEVALWWPAQRTLIVAEALGTVEMFALGRPAGVHPLLRMVPPRAALSGFGPERLLVGHGPALETGAAAAVDGALAHSRADMPKLLRSLPSVLRGANG